MEYKDINSAQEAIKQITEAIKNINKQISEYYRNPELASVIDRNKEWLQRAMYSKSHKRNKIIKINQWIWLQSKKEEIKEEIEHSGIKSYVDRHFGHLPIEEKDDGKNI
jgi:23S rRNA G2069 N7-methylase RlmK/C1962 C5-methylase RlmI